MNFSFNRNIGNIQQTSGIVPSANTAACGRSATMDRMECHRVAQNSIRSQNPISQEQDQRMDRFEFSAPTSEQYSSDEKTGAVKTGVSDSPSGPDDSLFRLDRKSEFYPLKHCLS
jgi:hypothetical protein